MKIIICNLFFYVINPIKSKLEYEIKSEVQKLFTDWFILIVSTMPALGLALLVLSLAIYLDYFTDFIVS